MKKFLKTVLFSAFILLSAAVSAQTTVANDTTKYEYCVLSCEGNAKTLDVYLFNIEFRSILVDKSDYLSKLNSESELSKEIEKQVEIVDVLSILGNQGWKLVNVLYLGIDSFSNLHYRYIFIREK